MRKLFSYTIIGIIAIQSSCIINGDINLDKYPPCAAGNCDIITEERILPPFTQIKHSFVGKRYAVISAVSEKRVIL